MNEDKKKQTAARILGIFAGVGCGKTAVLEILKNRYGAFVLEADKVAHELYKRGEKGYAAAVALLGMRIVGEDGQPDRKLMGDILYRDAELLNQLNAQIHPMVWAEIAKCTESLRLQEKLIVIEAALLPNQGDFDICRDFFDEIWYIHTELPVRLERLEKNRGYTRERAMQIMNRQPSEEDYRAFADRVIENNADILTLQKAIEEALALCGWHEESAFSR